MMMKTLAHLQKSNYSVAQTETKLVKKKNAEKWFSD